MAGVNISQIKKKDDKGQKDWFSFLQKDISFKKGLLSDKVKEFFYAQLAVLLTAGVDLQTALGILEKEYKDEKVKTYLNQLNSKLLEGNSFSVCLKQVLKVSDFEFYSVEIGEQIGKLDMVIADLAVFYERKIDQKRQLVKALTYPAIILSISILTVSFMMYFVVPMFEDLFTQFNAKLPWITEKVLAFYEVFIATFPYFLLFVFFAIVGVAYVRDNEWYKKYSAKIQLNFPVFGTLIYKVKMAQFCSIMSLMLKSKVPLVESVKLISNMIDFYPIKKSLIEIEQMLINGTSLNECLAKYPIYDDRLISLVKVGEDINELESFFDKLQSQYKKDVDHQTSLIGSLIEPFILIFLGLIVGVILIAMYLPMFQLGANV